MSKRALPNQNSKAMLQLEVQAWESFAQPENPKALFQKFQLSVLLKKRRKEGRKQYREGEKGRVRQKPRTSGHGVRKKSKQSGQNADGTAQLGRVRAEWRLLAGCAEQRQTET